MKGWSYMAIDISTDLVITLLAQNIQTPTINGVYDTGSPPDTYLPGKDFSPTDNVSTGNTANFNFSIAFDSLSNQIYNLDMVYIQTVDDPRTDGTGRILGYWINTNSDPSDTTDDGQNTLIPGYFSNMSSIVFDSSANIKSNSTVLTGITVTLPITFWWKSKIMPTIQVVAVKDGITKVSSPLTLPTVNLSTVAALITTLLPNGNMSYTDQGGNKGFIVPFYFRTYKEVLPNIAQMNDNPEFDLITYKVDFSASVNSVNIPVTTANFTVTSTSNATVSSYDYQAGAFTITLKQTDPGQIFAIVYAFLPFDPGALTSATVSVVGNWDVLSPVSITDFTNSILFIRSHGGSFTQTQNVVIVPEPPEDKIYLSETIFGNLSNSSIFQALSYRYYSCPRPLNSKFIKMIDSKVASFGDTVTTRYTYYDTNGVFFIGEIPANSYTVLYAEYDFNSVYDPNTIGELVASGAITLLSYADMIAQNKIPNILVATITQDLFAGIDVDYDNAVSFDFNGNLDVLTQYEFKDLYDIDPQSSYPSYIYSYMSLNTCYNTVAQAYATVGTLLQNGGVSPTIDSFTLRNGSVFLNLGTKYKTILDASVARFNGTSFVRALLPLDTIVSNLYYAISNQNDAPITTITDYTREYCLLVRYRTLAYATVPQGTTVTITLPNALLPYFYISDTPYVRVSLDNGSVLLPVLITEYSLVGAQLSVTLPIEMSMRPDDICIPVKFITPSLDLVNTFGPMVFSKPLVYTQDPNSLLYGFTTESELFRVISETVSFTLRGAQIDTTGLFVSPTVYDYGQKVTYIATVYNQSFTPTSDYCMAMTVPTNQYNPVTTSNNTQLAHITGINLTNPNTVLYFQTAPNVTALDILVVKNINVPGIPTLNVYFDTVVVNNWTKYVVGMTLPAQVVMMIACTDGMPQNQLVRIDYDVVVDIPANTDQHFINNAVFNYYSSGSNLEAQSNVVSISNRIATSVPIIKRPSAQVAPLVNGSGIKFESYFTAPLNPLFFKTFTITDTLHPSLTFDPTSTSVLIAPNTPIAYTVSVDSATNTVAFKINNTAQIAGNVVIINIATVLTNSTLVPYDPTSFGYYIINNQKLIVNDNPSLSSTSNDVYVIFTVQPPIPIPIVKSPQIQRKPYENGTSIEWTLTFDAPSENRVYTSFTVTDTLHASLSLDATSLKVAANGQGVPFAVVYDDLTKVLEIKFPNSTTTAGKQIVVTIGATVVDVTKIPANRVIHNFGVLILNDIPTIYSNSNVVDVIFDGRICPRNQAISDLIESVVLEQTALSHIINAEGMKLERIVATPNISIDQILATNNSVADMLNTISRLELTLQGKLELFEKCLCNNDNSCV